MMRLFMLMFCFVCVQGTCTEQMIQFDLSEPSPPDLKSPPDMKPPTDMMPPPDLKPPPDLQEPPDLAPPVDQAVWCNRATRVAHKLVTAS